MSEVVIRAEHLGKRYRIGPRERYKALRDTLTDAICAPFRRLTSRFRGGDGLGWDGAPENTIWALKGVSFEVERGAVLGIIGRNGAGKSTLLKILSRVTEPTEGYAELHGRVGSLLEIGIGFHPELTGRENIYLSGAILGMKKREVEKKFDEIVAFAEVEQFIDTPVKHYSSGMYVRLAFGLAAHLEPEILLVDEVLAVGDASFQQKCLGRMSEVSGEGRTVLFVSHNMAAVQHLCTQGILLERGAVVSAGPVEEVIAKYQTAVAREKPVGFANEFPSRSGTGKIRFKAVTVTGGRGDPWLRPDEPVRIEMHLEAAGQYEASTVTVGIGINDPFGGRLVTLLNKFDPNAQRTGLKIGPDTLVVCRLPKLLLRAGRYHLALYIDIGGEISDRIRDALAIEVQETDFYGTGRIPTISQGPLLLEQSWDYVDQTDQPDLT